MGGTHESMGKDELIARTLCDKRADFEAFVRARVRSEEANDILQLAALRAIERMPRNQPSCRRGSGQ